MTDRSYAELLTAAVELNLTDFQAKMRTADAAVDALSDEKKKTTTFEGIGSEMVAAAVDAMWKFSEDVMTQSLVEVPKDTLVLQNSADTVPPVRIGNRVKVSMGCGYGDEVNPITGRIAAQYAIPVHEIYHAEHEPPTKDHFLLDPLILEAGTLGAKMAVQMKMAAAGRSRLTLLESTGADTVLNLDYTGTPVAEAPSYGGGPSLRGPGGRFIGGGKRLKLFDPRNWKA